MEEPSEFQSLFEKSNGDTEKTLEKDMETGVPLLKRMDFTDNEAVYIIEQLRSFSASKEGEPSVEASATAKLLQIVASLEASLREQGQ